MRKLLHLCLAYLARTGKGNERQVPSWQAIDPIHQARGFLNAKRRFDHLNTLAIFLVAGHRAAAFKSSESRQFLANTPAVAYSCPMLLDSRSLPRHTKDVPHFKWQLPWPRHLRLRSSLLCMGRSSAVYTPLVICGPSGVGKGTLIKRLMREFPGKFGFCVSTTTRAPRPREVDGQDYHFVDHETMLKQIGEGSFVEHAAVHTNYYGTSIAALEAVVSKGKVVILDIDIQGAKQVKEKLPDVHYVFLAPVSMEELEERLRRRGTETEEKVRKRLANAVGEIEFAMATPSFWDEIIYADDNWVEALPKMRRLLKKWYPQLDKRIPA